ncbi:uncharacterized protein [Nicotiana tomentosiformis]|uniref:uncharacterized protein n=1 Tax=Nicotiana tomentosiformis TaxID=4098 RepID=UPI00388C7887
MVRTRSTGSGRRPPIPPARAARGRDYSRGRGVALTTTKATHVEPPVAPVEEHVPDVVEPVGSAQAAGPIVIPGLQEALAQILTVCTSLAQAVLVPVVPATSQVEGGAQTLVAHTLEQLAQGLQTPGVLAAHPVTIARAEVDPPMSDEEQKILEHFGRRKPPEFNGEESEDAQDFLDRCQRILHTSAIFETSRVVFTTFQLTEAAYRWWHSNELSRPVGVTSLTWHEFSILFLEKFVL